MKIDKRTKEERMEALRNMTDKDIDYSDIPPLDDYFWKNAKVMPPLINKKQQISIRLKPSTIKIIKLQSKKENIPYQTIISNLLDNYAIHISNEK